ncbi:CheR family methyltransferase [Litoribrevibacter albus]|uniref:protein-glutamate O-methyltransferase n=1 Tax=Litoribrevibacter albus TaxID=1473156 RepID=A0AA37S9C6_9GAMM|nr:CheR family methyltransferase [Litoribrevibacter albus]GLQ30573.1 methyltransferase PilK [Litoribrevibacter albus]
MSSKDEADRGNGLQNTMFGQFDDQSYEQWRALIEQRTGLQLADHLRTYLQGGLNRRMKLHNIHDYEQYLEYVTNERNGIKEWSELIDTLTVQETQFFRHLDSYSFIETYLKELVDSSERTRSIEMWSVGCSSGEESYSLAMLAEKVLTESEHMASYGVIGTDISLSAISSAKLRIYKARKADWIPDHYHHCFDRLDNTIKIKQRIADRVCFARVNILDLDRVPIRDMDIIFCQNLLIYLRKWRRKEVVNRLSERLKVGGILVLGLGEVTDWSHPKLRQVDSRDVLAFERFKA